METELNIIINSKQKGMSLIELMIALLIGLLLSAAIITVYLSNKKTFWDTEAAAGLQENSRFAMKLITNDLRLAGFYGGVDHKVIDTSSGDVTAFSTGSCERGGEATEFDYERSIWVATVASLPGCIGSKVTAGVGEIGSDVLFVKHVARKAHVKTKSTEANKTYIIAALDHAGHFNGTGDASLQTKVSPAGEFPYGEIWEYNYYAYYISHPAGVAFPQLKRLKMTNNSWVVETVADGIEDIHFEFGVDTHGVNNLGNDDTTTPPDGKVDAYIEYSTDSGYVQGNWENVISVKLYLLAQATTSDMSFTDNKNYVYAERDYTPAARSKYHRKLFETTVTLFNNQMERTRGLSNE